MELQDIIPCDPPVPPVVRAKGPSLPVDEAIMNALRAGPSELWELTKATGDTTHHVHARVVTLMKKGLVVRERRTATRDRGPGASVYRLAGD